MASVSNEAKISVIDTAHLKGFPPVSRPTRFRMLVLARARHGGKFKINVTYESSPQFVDGNTIPCVYTHVRTPQVLDFGEVIYSRKP